MSNKTEENINFINKKVIVLGKKGVGKTKLLDSLLYLSSAKFGLEGLELASDIEKTIPTSITGKKNRYDYNILLSDSKNNVNLIINEVTIPDFSNETKESFFDYLSEDNTDYDYILYMLDGSKSRLDIHIKTFIRRLIINYGEEILKNLVILQSKSNMIRCNYHYTFSELNLITPSDLKICND